MEEPRAKARVVGTPWEPGVEGVVPETSKRSANDHLQGHCVHLFSSIRLCARSGVCARERKKEFLISLKEQDNVKKNNKIEFTFRKSDNAF